MLASYSVNSNLMTDPRRWEPYGSSGFWRMNCYTDSNDHTLLCERTMAYQLIWETYGLRIDHSGALTVGEVDAINETLFVSERYDTLYYQVVNLLEVERYEITTRDLFRLGAIEKAGSLSLKVVKMRIAMVAKDGPEIRDLYPAYVKLFAGSGLECELFEDLVSAQSWAREHSPEPNQA